MTGVSTLKVGLIGYGKQGRMHFQALQPYVLAQRVKVCGICDVVESAREEDIPFFTSYTALIKKTSPDVIIVTLPNAFHFDVCMAGLEHGCDIVKEKPLALTRDQASTLHQLAQKKGKLLITLQQRYYQPLYQSALQLVPLLGKVKRFSYVFTVNDMQKSWYWERKLAGGGSWLNMGWHAMSVLHWMFGTPEDVAVAWNIGGQRTWQYDTEHSALAKLRYRQGITGTVFVSCIYQKEETLKVYGEHGQLSCSRDELTLTLPTGKVTAVTSASSEDAYINQYKDVFERLNTRVYPFQRDLDVLRTILSGYDTAFETSLEEMREQGALYDSFT